MVYQEADGALVEVGARVVGARVAGRELGLEDEAAELPEVDVRVRVQPLRLRVALVHRRPPPPPPPDLVPHPLPTASPSLASPRLDSAPTAGRGRPRVPLLNLNHHRNRNRNRNHPARSLPRGVRRGEERRGRRVAARQRRTQATRHGRSQWKISSPALPHPLALSLSSSGNNEPGNGKGKRVLLSSCFSLSRVAPRRLERLCSASVRSRPQRRTHMHAAKSRFFHAPPVRRRYGPPVPPRPQHGITPAHFSNRNLSHCLAQCLRLAVCLSAKPRFLSVRPCLRQVGPAGDGVSDWERVMLM